MRFGWSIANRMSTPGGPTVGRHGQRMSAGVLIMKVVSPQLATRIRSAQIYRASYFSDHAPVIVCYDIPKWAVGEDSGDDLR